MPLREGSEVRFFIGQNTDGTQDHAADTLDEGLEIAEVPEIDQDSESADVTRHRDASGVVRHLKLASSVSEFSLMLYWVHEDLIVRRCVADYESANYVVRNMRVQLQEAGADVTNIDFRGYVKKWAKAHPRGDKQTAQVTIVPVTPGTTTLPTIPPP